MKPKTDQTLVERYLLSSGVIFESIDHEEPGEHAGLTQHTDLQASESIKCLGFRSGDDRLILVGFPGDHKVRYGHLARALGVSRSSLKPASAEELDQLQMLPGGVVPIQVNPSATVVFDSAVPSMGLIYCGSGRPGRSLRLAAVDLVDLAVGPIVAKIAD